MNQQELHLLATRFLNAWNTQEVDQVLKCYTNDVLYRDPNTRGIVQGQENLSRYLKRLFENWQMHWSLREGFPLQSKHGAAILWQATFQKKESPQVLEAEGMDLVLLEGDRIQRNEVYFDRILLLPLMGVTGQLFHSFSKATALFQRQVKKVKKWV